MLSTIERKLIFAGNLQMVPFILFYVFFLFFLLHVKTFACLYETRRELALSFIEIS